MASTASTYTIRSTLDTQAICNFKTLVRVGAHHMILVVITYVCSVMMSMLTMFAFVMLAYADGNISD